jgi:hypothetical protein
MRLQVSDIVRFCLAKARECRRGAERASVSSRRQSWLEMEGLWFYLARSYDDERRPNGVLRASAGIESKSVRRVSVTRRRKGPGRTVETNQRRDER